MVGKLPSCSSKIRASLELEIIILIKTWLYRNTASETVRTLLVYGYVLDPPSSDQQNAEADEGADKATTSRTYRLEKNYAVGAGKW